MFLWTWVLLGLCLAGLALAIVSSIAVAARAMRLMRRLRTLRESHLMMSVQGLQLQAARLSAMPERVEPLVTRASAAVTTIQEAATVAQLPQAQNALRDAGRDIGELAEDLR